MPKATRRWTGTIQGRDEQRSLKRQAVLAVGAKLFSEKGYVQTSLDEIAEVLGISKPTLYYYVKSKEEVLFECIRVALAEVHAALDGAKDGNKSALDQLCVFFERYALHLLSDFGRCSATVDIRELDEKLKHQIIRARREIDHKIRALMDQAVRDGSIAPLNVKMATFFIFGAFNWIPQWCKLPGPKAEEEIAAEYAKMLKNMLCNSRKMSGTAKRAQ